MKQFFIGLVLLLVPLKCHAAIALVQDNDSSVGTVAPITAFIAPSTAGDMLLVESFWTPNNIFVKTGTAGGCTVTDNMGNIYTPAPSAQASATGGTALSIALMYSTGTIGGVTSISAAGCSINGGVGAQLFVSEWSGGIIGVDVSSSAGTTSGIPVGSLTLTPTTTNGLIYFATRIASSFSTGINSPWNHLASDPNFNQAYLINTGSSGPLAPTFVSASQNYITVGASFIVPAPLPPSSITGVLMTFQ